MKCLSTLILFFMIAAQKIFAQDFYSGYLKELNTNIATCKIPDQNKRSITMLKQLFTEVEQGANVKMLIADKIYMISYSHYNYPTSQVTMLVWTGSHACHYSYTYTKNNIGKITGQALNFEIDAYKRLSALRPQLRKWVEAADTSNFNTYKRQRSNMHEKEIESLFLKSKDPNSSNVSDGGMFFTVATRSGPMWRFVSSNMYQANL